jgi:cyanophycin synthetase
MVRMEGSALIEAACDALGYGLRRLDTRLLLIEHADCRLPLLPGYWPLNPRAACALVEDKRHCGALLRASGFSTPEESAVVLPLADAAWPALRARFHAFGGPVLVKPARGTLGRGIARITDAAGLRRHLALLAGDDDGALMQRWIEAPEYRLFHLDGEPVFGYRRTPPEAVGDGRRTLRDHVDALQREASAFSPDRGWILDQLRALGLDWTTPLPDGVRLRLSACANGFGGGRFDELRVQGEGAAPFPPGCADWLRRLGRTVGLRLFAVDLFSASALRDPDDYCVLDVNANPQIESLAVFGRRDLQLQLWTRVLRAAMAEASG